MEAFFGGTDPESPENIIFRLVARLRQHALWDALSIYLPPFAVAAYLAAYSYHAAWIAQATFLGLTVVAIVLGVVAVVGRYRPCIPSAFAAARMVDERAAAQDRFVTLATIAGSARSASFIGRLRREASGFLHRIDLKKDFPYRLKRSFYRSIVGSFIAVILFHLVLQVAEGLIPPGPDEQLRRVAAQLAQTPRYEDLTKTLEALADKLKNPALSDREKQELLREALQKLEARQKKEEQEDGRNLLGQAANTVRGLEQSAGQDQQRDQDKGGGGVQSNLPQQGEGEGRSEKGDGGAGQGDIQAQLTKELQDGKSAQGDPREAGKEKAPGNRGAGKGADPDRQKGREMTGKAEGGSEEKVGKSKAEEIPRGTPPAERFLQPGEQGKEGIKGARFVTVQLPEAIAQDASGEGGSGKATKVYPKVPISNAPLPAHVPDAPAEKQPLPLEYRGIIR